RPPERRSGLGRALRLAPPPLFVLAGGPAPMASSDKAPPHWGGASPHTHNARKPRGGPGAQDPGYFSPRPFADAPVHYALRARGAALDEQTVQRGFEALDLVLLVASALVWAVLAERLSLRPTARWLGFVLLFVNYGVLRWLFGVPALTDASGFALGM